MRIRPGIILLLLWGIFLAAADVLYLKYLQPSRLGKTVAGILHDATGLTPVIARLSFSLVPRAGVEIHGLTLQPETGHHQRRILPRGTQLAFSSASEARAPSGGTAFSRV